MSVSNQTDLQWSNPNGFIPEMAELINLSDEYQFKLIFRLANYSEENLEVLVDSNYR